MYTPLQCARFWRYAYIRYDEDMAYYKHMPPTKEQMKKRIYRFVEKQKKAELRYTQEHKIAREARNRI